ncbi:Pkinase-domain-containing protein [Suhomyces tanzawaensis NRRL Y-17324]|uniref:Pkinase-domain-containing protein n=1 Tax=Suhomyces tanzawaensis NRRL Y-17324 TaxID=984487 RepID=A0A1E4SD95_9ASCO|nr:Pkinase-domain-containing protein [Suhomyces tanzawaensis NRRL Y-17324]ODV77491.1 Pkinase-domain-containing protein [Suhomyces tanzawaensis NRRL Y-17324]
MTLMLNFKKLFVSTAHDGSDRVADPKNASINTPQPSLSPAKLPVANPEITEPLSTKTSPLPPPAYANPVFSLNGSLNDNYPDLPPSYRLICLLGEGAFSTVYKAIDTSHDDATVAIKIISKDHLSAKQLNNIKNEIHIMQKLGKHHPNILKLLHYIDTPHHCFLILEYCNGGEIFNKIIEYTYFSEQLSRHVFKQLLSAIEYLHNHNIVHRDIKPENLLFNQIPYMPRSTQAFKDALRKSDDSTKIDEGAFKPNHGGGTIGIIKLADFGLAKQLPSASSFSVHQNLKTPCGTAGYTAPEVITCNTASPTDINGGVSSFSLRKKTFPNKISRKNYYSKAVDIWSLGCFLYTILCGFPPFYDEDPNQLTHKILNGDFEYLKPWWDEVSDDAKDLISQMINTDPETRISIDEIWQHPWVKEVSNDQSGNYFGEAYHEYEVHELDPFSKDNDVEHVEFALKSNSHSPLHLHPSIPPTDNSFFGTCGPSAQPLPSPRAEAIKRVFDNPAMIGTRAAVSVSGVDVAGELVSSGEDFSAKHKSSVVQFIENIEERSHDEDDTEDSDITSFSSSSDDHFVAKRGMNRIKNIPRTPNPTKDQLNKLNFKDVFKINSNYTSSSQDDENEDSEKDDQITSLETTNSRRKNSSKTKVAGIFSHDEDADLSSTNSLTDGEEEEDYQTRSSSIISGINGDFKFTLNLNESNLLSRRRSSTISKSLKKTQSNNSPSLPHGNLTSTIG